MRRALELLEAIVKELSKATLKISALRTVAPKLMRVLLLVFIHNADYFLEREDDAEFTVEETNALGLLLPATSTIRRLLVRGCQFPHNDETSATLFMQSWRFWLGRVNEPHPAGNGEASTSKKMLEKTILQISKLHLELAEDNPVAFVLLPSSRNVQNKYFDIVYGFADHYGADSFDASKLESDGDGSEKEQTFIEQLILKAFLVIRATLRAMADPNAIKARSDEDKAEKGEVIQILQTDFFPLEWVRILLETIISKYFIFRSSDLRRWEEEPDEWEAVLGADTEGYRYSVRMCAEKLFIDLVHRFTDAIIPTVINLVQTATGSSDVGPLQKESVYTALGLAADKIMVYYEKQASRYDFNQSLPSLVADLQNRDPSYRLIRRRIAILLGKWIHIQVAKGNRQVVYQIFLHLLDKDDQLNDIVVRVTAGRQLKEVISDWEFEAAPFLPYAADTISRMMSLIAEVELPETKMALLETISAIVENMGKHIGPFADNIVSILPSLWDETGEETLRKQVIVTLLVNMFSSMGSESKQYQNFALFIIKAVLCPDSSLPKLERMALLADALDLWRAVLDNTPTTSVRELHSDLLYLLKSCLIPSLSMDSEARRAALEITSSYCLLIPADFLSEQSFVVELLRCQATDLRELKPEASAQVFEVVEQLVRVAEDLAQSKGVETVANAMLESGFFRELLLGLRESYEAHQTTGPKSIVSNVQGQVETDFFAILARILYSSPELFLFLLRNPDAGLNTNLVATTMNWLLEEWLSHAQELVVDPARQKLLTLALTHLLTASEPFILSRLQQLMDLWISVIESLTEGNEDKNIDSLVYTTQQGEFLASDGQSAGEARRAALQSTDPVHKVNLKEAVKYAVGITVERCGGPQRFQDEWLVNVDKEIVQQFGQLNVV